MSVSRLVVVAGGADERERRDAAAEYLQVSLRCGLNQSML